MGAASAPVMSSRRASGAGETGTATAGRPVARDRPHRPAWTARRGGGNEAPQLRRFLGTWRLNRRRCPHRGQNAWNRDQRSGPPILAGDIIDEPDFEPGVDDADADRKRIQHGRGQGNALRVLSEPLTEFKRLLKMGKQGLKQADLPLAERARSPTVVRADRNRLGKPHHLSERMTPVVAASDVGVELAFQEDPLGDQAVISPASSIPMPQEEVGRRR